MAAHTYSHPDMRTLSSAQIRAEMNRMDAALRDTLCVRPRFMRPPFGLLLDNQAELLNSMGFTIVGNDTLYSSTVYSTVLALVPYSSTLCCFGRLEP